MTEENNNPPKAEESSNPPKRVVKQVFEGKFGVSDNPADHGFGRHPEVTDPDAHESRSERKEFERSQERKPMSSDERRPAGGDNDRFRDRKPYGDRDSKPYGERRPFGDRDRERKPFDRDGGDRRPYGDRGARPYGERRPFGDRDRERRPFNRDGGDRRPYGDRGARPYGERRPFGDRDRERRPFNRDDRRGFDRNRGFENSSPFGEDNRPIYRQKPETKPEGDEEIVRDEDAVLAEADRIDSAAPETKASNPPWFRRLLALTTEKGREREGQFLAEGVRVVEEMLSNHQDLVIGIYVIGEKKLDENGETMFDENGDAILVPGKTHQDLIEKARNASINIHALAEEQFKGLSSTVTTQGILAICRMASAKPNCEKSRSILTLVDAVQDPGNLGAIFRTSLGFNSSGVIVGKGSVNPFNPKVVRGSSGTFLRVPFEKDRDLIDAINELHKFGYTIIATDLHGKQSLAEIAPKKLCKVAFLVGNEGAGTDQHLIDISDETVRIPMSSDLESLNVAVAHGILSYEMVKIQKDLV